MPDTKSEAQLIQEQVDRESNAENAQKTMRYRWSEGGVEKKLFNHPDDIPGAEGWTDSPAKCDGPPANGLAKITETPLPEKVNVTFLSKEIEDMPVDEVKVKDLRSRYTELTGKKFKFGVTKDSMQQMIRYAQA